jgi:argininosuccinate lyase
MWKGRFASETAPALRRFSESVSFDWRLFAADIRGSIAHAGALRSAGLLTDAEHAAIVGGLDAIGDEIAAGKFEFDTALEDVHMNIEAELTRRIGPAGAKLHTARSRNDQVATDLRLFLRDAAGTVGSRVRNLQRALLALGERHHTAVIPGYTHLQRAQPVLFAHHLLAYVEMLERDAGRIADAARRMNVLPLGSGAIAGSTIVLDREQMARALGFDAVSRNSMDAVSDRDFACEFLSALAILGMHLSRLSEDVILWASAEFGFLRLSDAYTTGSSLMPQKKNPDVAELTRGKTGRLYGNLLALLTVLKGLPLAYNRDMQEDKEPVFDSIDTVSAALEVFAGMLDEAVLDEANAARAAGDPQLLATDLADWLVLRGLPFRHAHETIGRLVRIAAERSVSIADLSVADMQEVCNLFDDDALTVFHMDRALAARKAPGAPSPANVSAQLTRWRIALGH